MSTVGENDSDLGEDIDETKRMKDLETSKEEYVELPKNTSTPRIEKGGLDTQVSNYFVNLSLNDFEEHLNSMRRAYLQKSRRSKDGVNLAADLMLRDKVRDEGEPESGGDYTVKLAKSVKAGQVGIDPKGEETIEDGASLTSDLTLSGFEGFDLVREGSYIRNKRDEVGKYKDLVDKIANKNTNYDYINKVVEQDTEERGKRKGEWEGNPFRKKKKTFAEAAKDGFLVEVRVLEQDYLVTSEDFRWIDAKLADIYVDDDSADFEFESIQAGISNNGLWWSCKNLESLIYFQENLPTVPAQPDRPTATFKAYGPGERPYRYFRARVGALIWRPADAFLKLVRKFNRDLKINGQDLHIRVVGGCQDKIKEMKSDERRGDWFWVRLEVEEELFSRILDKQGKLRLGIATTTTLFGGGIEKGMVERGWWTERVMRNELTERFGVSERFGLKDNEQETAKEKNKDDLDQSQSLNDA